MRSIGIDTPPYVAPRGDGVLALPDAEEVRHRRVLAIEIGKLGREPSLPVAYQKIRPVLHEHAHRRTRA